MAITKGKVLVIEDDPKWSNLLKDYLEEAGYYVDMVSNLQDAIEIIQHQTFHFITVDMQLDRKTTQTERLEGWNILRLVKKMGIEQRTPVMVVTAFEPEYKDLKNNNEFKSLFLMGKGNFDKEEFLKIVDRTVNFHDLRFKDDKRHN